MSMAKRRRNQAGPHFDYSLKWSASLYIVGLGHRCLWHCVPPPPYAVTKHTREILLGSKDHPLKEMAVVNLPYVRKIASRGGDLEFLDSMKPAYTRLVAAGIHQFPIMRGQIFENRVNL